MGHLPASQVNVASRCRSAVLFRDGLADAAVPASLLCEGPLSTWAVHDAPSLDAALQRAVAAGGAVALPRQALPEGMGFFAHITDLDGNRVGLHALA